MTALILELPAETYERLRRLAQATGRPVADLAAAQIHEWVANFQNERERSQDILRSAGLLAEPSVEMRSEAAQSAATLEEVSATLSRPGGRPLSEIIIAQRGSGE